jgi:hypothetical protein
LSAASRAHRSAHSDAHLYAAPYASVERLRILCLNGYHDTGAALRRQPAGLAAALAPVADLVYADAPSLADGGFGWWHEGFAGWEGTRERALDALRAGPCFDGLLGFSRGAALAGLLAAVLETGSAELRLPPSTSP